jgi:hypothetical protein
MSEKDIDVGSVWFDEIGFSVLDARFAIICLTPENVAGTWLHFEAGAIGMRRDEEGKRRPVAPYLLDLEPKDVPHPLAFFNARGANRDGTLTMVRSLNKHLAVPLGEELLESTFEVWWPWLEEALAKIPKPAESDVESSTRSPEDVLEEILSLVRSIATESVTNIVQYVSHGSYHSGTKIEPIADEDIQRPVDVSTMPNLQAPVERSTLDDESGDTEDPDKW